MKSYPSLQLLLFTFWLVLLWSSCREDPVNRNELSEEEKSLLDFSPPENPFYFIDKKGEQIGPSWDAAKSFSEGMAAVNRGGKWGFMDKDGDVIIQPQYKNVFPFEDGIAMVQQFDLKYNFVNKSGSVLLKDAHENIKALRPDRFLICDNNNCHIFTEKSDTIHTFKNMPITLIDSFLFEKQNKQSHIYSADGEQILSVPMDRFQVLGKYFKIKKDAMWHLYDGDQKKYIIKNKLKISDLQDGQLYASNKKGMWQKYNLTGDKISEDQIEANAIVAANNGMWIAVGKKVMSLIGNKNETLLRASEISPWKDNRIVLREAMKYDVRDRKLNSVLTLNNGLIWQYSNGLARITSNGISYADTNGQIVLSNKYIDAHDFIDDRALVQSYH